jgi:hypothetical protein
MNPHCRIGRVKLRNGGELRVLPVPARDDMKSLLMASAGRVASANDLEMAGYCVIAWDVSGHYTCGWRIDRDGVLQPTMIPTFIADIMRRELIEIGFWG